MSFRAILRAIGFRDLLVLLGLIGARVLLRLYELPDRVEAIAGKALAVAIVLQVWLTLRRIVNVYVDGRIRHYAIVDPGRTTSLEALRIVAQAVLLVTLLLFGLDNFGVNVTTLVAGLGIGGIAIALAVQSILGDLFASVSIVLDKPFVVGDSIQVGEMAGIVENIGIKTTRVRATSGEQLVFPNSDLLGSRVRNFKRMQERRYETILGLTYDTPAEKLKRIPDWIREAVEAQPGLRFDRAHFMRFGAYSLDIQMVYYVLSPDYLEHMDRLQAVNLALLERFAREGVDFAFPTQVTMAEKPAAGAKEVVAPRASS
jgi:small-conductance mechanosensitive channel